MTHIALYAHSLNSHVNATLRNASGYDTTVLLTNVHYADDAAMQELLRRKHAEYRYGTRLLSTPHDLIPTLLNISAHTVIVDSLNFVVSNLLLLYNTEDEATRQAVERKLCTDLARLDALRHTLSIDRLIFLTSDVDHDHYIRSRIGHRYRQTLHAVNRTISTQLADEYAVLLNGALLSVALHHAY